MAHASSAPGIVVLSASPNVATSTTRRAVSRLFDHVAAQGGGTGHRIIDVPLLPGLAAPDRASAGPELEAALRATETASLILAATPVYKGSYPGLFKHFVDLLDYRALVGVPVGLLASGGSDRHALVIEHQLRPLFSFFQAQVLATGVFVTSRHVEADGRVEAEIDERLRRLAHEIVVALDYAPALTAHRVRDAA